MAEHVIYPSTRPQIPLSRILLPTEHGSWSFLLEPLLVGCAIAPSAASPWIVLMVAAAFFARQPLKVYFRAHGNAVTRSVAIRLFSFFLAAAAIGLAAVVSQSSVRVLFPFVAAAPLAQAQLFADATGKSRSLFAELAGAVAIAASSASLALAAGLSWVEAIVLWSIFASRFTSSILYVRNRLLLEKGRSYDSFWPAASHLLGAVLVGSLAVNGLASILTAVVFVLLLIRSTFGLSIYRRKMKAMQIGVWEVVYGALTVASMIVGSHLDF